MLARANPNQPGFTCSGCNHAGRRFKLTGSAPRKLGVPAGELGVIKVCPVCDENPVDAMATTTNWSAR